ncbi:MAG: ABC transporter ATP-binding protein [Planctomycetes bacterium]|nr:ABC transporter ATP-binding protein [Planctomycetota bacterium]
MSEKGNLTAFWRVLGYVWPQWPRLIAVFLWAILISAMFSASFLTIIPLLKVMMEEEGLHSWVDRKICAQRYGMDFYVPSRSDFADEGAEETQYLLINRIDQNKWADRLDLRRGDMIAAVKPEGALEPMTQPGKMLEVLATSETQTVLELTIRRPDAQGQIQVASVSQAIPPKPFFADAAQWPLSFIPRDGSREAVFHAMILVIVGLTIVTILRCLARFYQTFLAEKIVSIANAQLREDVFRHVMFMPVGFFASRGTSDTTSRIISDVAMSGRGIKIMFGKTLREPMVAIGALFTAFLINWKLSLLFLCSGPLVIGVIAILGRKMKKAARKSLVSTAHLLGRIQEAMAALRVIKVYNRQNWEIEQYEKNNRSLLKYQLRISKIESMTSPLMDALGMIVGGGVILVGAAWVTFQYDGMQPSSFFALLAGLGVAAESVRKLSDVWNNVQQANAAAERVFAVLDEPLEKEAPDAFELKPLSREIVFRDIVFTYPGASQPALNGINLTVPAGQTVAIVGANGSGKTTLVNLLPRFYDPDSGQILIDDQDIQRATLASLRDQIGMVTQNVVTFHDTVANNIAYSKPDATREEIIAAAKKAYAHEFICTLPGGYDSMIGEQSSGFSGGQLQRIVIARAILKNPKILIFDEAMSQIDADSEAKIHKALGELMKGRTCFLIAHRFSTVISADRIVVLDGGQIVGQGRHEELMQTCPTYMRLYETQLIGKAQSR